MGLTDDVRFEIAFDASALRERIEEIFSGIKPAFAALGEAANEAAARIGGFTRTTEAKLLYYRRCEFGGNAYDAHKWPDQWQSVQCAAWLPDCPSDEHDLRCTGARHSR